MLQVGLWQVTNSGPAKLTSSNVSLESHLEAWIEKDPTLLQSGLTIVGRQMHVEAGILDLLAVDVVGRWAVIEIKREAVYRDTIIQALDYASCIAAMPIEELTSRVNAYLAQKGQTLDSVLSSGSGGTEGSGVAREVRIFVVGTDQGPGLGRIVGYLSGTYGIPITVVSYQVFQVADGQRVLVRELTETETAAPPPTVQTPTLEQLCHNAEEAGIGPQFRAILDAAQRHGMYPRLWPQSIMYAPLRNRSRCLFTVGTQANRQGHLELWVVPEAFNQFYSLDEARVTNALGPLGPEGHRALSADEVDQFIEGLDELFEPEADDSSESSAVPTEAETPTER